jgi:hypothetical protein
MLEKKFKSKFNMYNYFFMNIAFSYMLSVKKLYIHVYKRALSFGWALGPK